MDKTMKRDRPYDGQPHTDLGTRGETEVRGLTFRDIRDCFIRGVMLAAGNQDPHRYGEAEKGEQARLDDNDLYALDWNHLGPLAIWNNTSCEIEKLMGIYPNIPNPQED